MNSYIFKKHTSKAKLLTWPNSLVYILPPMWVRSMHLSLKHFPLPLQSRISDSRGYAQCLPQFNATVRGELFANKRGLQTKFQKPWATPFVVKQKHEDREKMLLLGEVYRPAWPGLDQSQVVEVRNVSKTDQARVFPSFSHIPHLK